MFWTTQNWAAGSVISLSPFAKILKFSRDFIISDNIFDNFYRYTLKDANGIEIPRENIKIARTSGNELELRVVGTDVGLYNVTLPLVQKEHVVLIDNQTVFDDIVYQPTTGYRQERIKVTGYRSNDWNGSIDIPGFIYDEAIVTDWEVYKDYDVSAVVKYKEFYYIANQEITGKENFVAAEWTRIDERPESKLLPNFDYKINQFADFYDLDSDNFDSEQQRFAQHLIGYQKRDYLQNIINDDVSQYKFYQGMIADKGTRNVLTKLFDALSSADKDSLEFFEEWALKVGQYGATDNYEEVEFLLDEEQFKLSPQPVELVLERPIDATDLLYRQLPSEVYSAPADYTHRPFPVKDKSNNFLRSPGYINEEDINFRIIQNIDILTADIDGIPLGAYVWVAGQENSWDILQHVPTNYVVRSFETFNAEIDAIDGTPTPGVQVRFDTTVDLQPGDIIGIQNLLPSNNSFFVVDLANNNTATLIAPTDLILEDEEDTRGFVTAFRSVRARTADDFDDILGNQIYADQKIWLDSDTDNKWQVLDFKNIYSANQEIQNTTARGDESTAYNFASEIAVDRSNLLLTTGDYTIDKVMPYRRASDQSNFVPEESIENFKQFFVNSFTENGNFLEVETAKAHGFTDGDVIRFKSLSEDTTLGYVNNFYDLEIVKRLRLPRGNQVEVIDSTNFRILDIDTSVTPASEFILRVAVGIPTIGSDGVVLPTTSIYVSDLNTEFGKSIAISPDGKYMAIGSPKAGNISTRYRNIFDPDSTYATGDIVTYQDNLWRARNPVLPQFSNIEVDTFNSYAFLEQVNDSTAITLLLMGNPYVSQTTNHILVRAPIDMYQGSKSGDTTVLEWNKYTNLNRDPNDPFDNIQPFDGLIPEVDDTFISQSHTIAEKIDNILVIDNYVSVPAVGQTITTSTGQAKILDVYKDNTTLVIYTQGIDNTKPELGTNGVLLETDEVFANNILIGTYTQPNQTTNSVLGGWWKIDIGTSINNTLSPTGQNYWDDTGYGLVYRDFKVSGDTSAAKYYYNIQDDIFENIDDGFADLETSFIAPLSYRGDPQDQLDNYFSNQWVLRMPSSSTYSIGDSFNLWVNNSEDSFDISTINIPFSVANREQTIVDLWDGYIDIEYDNFQTVDTDGDGDIGDPFEPVVGDPIFGKILVSLTGSEAEVVYYQKDGINKARLYLKNATNPELYTIGRTIVRKGDSGAGISQRVMGNIVKTSMNGTRTGQLAVFDHTSNLAIDQDFDGVYFEEFFASNIEYWIYQQDLDIAGAERPASTPSSTNANWAREGRLRVDETGTENGLVEQGKFSIFERSNQKWQLIDEFVIPGTIDFAHVGEKLKFAKDKDLYRLYVVEKSETEAQKIHFVYHGTDDNGNVYNWELAYDPMYRGEHTTNVFYKQGEYVLFNNLMFRATTNLAAGAFNETFWEEVDSGVNYTASIPLANDLPFYFDNNYYAAQNPESLTTLEFAYDFDVNADGSVLVVSIDTDVVGDIDNRVLVYRLVEQNYTLSQVINSPNANTEFGESVSINEDGTILAIGDSKNDGVTTDNGRVYIYKLDNNQFELDQTIDSPRTSEVERFGENVSLTNNSLFVTSYNGDMVIPTTLDVFDNLDREQPQVGLDESDEPIYSKYVNSNLANVNQEPTRFDGGFTTFKNKNIDSGSVNIFENFEDKFIYANELKYFDVTASNFGETLLAADNHVYVGMPRYAETNGQIVEFITQKNTTSWNALRKELPIVDVDKIKQVFLYDTTTNQLVEYLDYIDPVQGKIAGPADRELYYKMYFDPALYNNTAIVGLFSETNNWGPDQVGRLWWDLTNVKFKDAYQGNAIWQANTWNTLIPGKSIDVYEWVESDVPPEDWDRIADTAEGTRIGYSGLSKYSNAVFSQKLVYDEVSKSFLTKYYFWVKDKKTTPFSENRTISAFDVAGLIANPSASNYRYAAFMTDNRFVLYNCNELIRDKEIALAVSYYTQDNVEQNSHIQYSILSEGLETSLPNNDLETKWIDSLVGYDFKGRLVPDPELSPRSKYGTLFQPRQGWFVNRFEALKQVIERVNISLAKKIVVDEYSLAKLNDKDPLPRVTERRYDVKIDTDDQLQFVGTSKAEPAVLRPIIVEGRIVAVSIDNPGRGYKDPTYVVGESTKRFGPNVEILGTGIGAEVELEIDNLGKVVNVTVLNEGSGYTSNTAIIPRRLSVLVETDTSIRNRWAIYQWNESEEQWLRTDTQDYDVTQYWNYADWYATGYNQFSPVDYLVDFSYQLYGLEDAIGDIVKISNIGSGGWLLLRKVNDTGDRDYTVDYETIGRQNGTIEISSSLYDYAQSRTGYDTFLYDGRFFDNEPTIETRRVLQALKDDILIDDLAKDYNELFFASIRYVFSEQPSVDWAFKTSFIKAKHNVGELSQKVTYQNDNLESYNDYIDEVKPFKTKIREYLSSYEKTDNTNSVIADFDLPPAYDETREGIYPKSIKVLNNELIGEDGLFDDYPDRNWLENVGFKVAGIHVNNPGRGYLTAPKVVIEGGGGSGATAKAYVGAGKITKVVVTNPGSGYLSAPTVSLLSNVDPDQGIEASLSAEIGDTVVRSMHVAVKFDRVTGDYTYTSLPETEAFSGTAVNTEFKLKWPMDLKTTKVRVTVDGIEMLRSEYTYKNDIKNSVTSSYETRDFNYGADNVAAGPGTELVKNGYTQRQGVIEFTNPPALDSVIEVTYYKDLSLLNAADRLYHFYKPTDGMLGNKPNLLMEGIDYGGVEVRSFDFDGPSGWDTDEWYSSTWDTYDNTFEDEIFFLDGSTVALELNTPLENGVVYNIYKNNVRIDDSNFGTAEPVTNPNAEMPSITGDGETTVINLSDYDVIAGDGDVFVVRKITSDGSFLPDPNSFDTLLTGGALDYSNAKGTAPEDIIVDGDGFVTATTSGGPEELVPGQVLDTVDIKVYERAGAGQGDIYNQNYKSNGTTVTYPLGIIPANNDSVIVKVAGDILESDEFTINWDDQTLTLVNTPNQGDRINILSIGASGDNVLDINTFITDGSTSVYETRVQWQEDLSFFITSNGVRIEEATIQESQNGLVEIVIPELDLLLPNTVVSYGVYVADGIQQFSLVQSDSFKGDGSTASFSLSQSPIYKTPSKYYTVARVGNKILSAGYNKTFAVSDQREYELDKFQYPASTLQTEDIEVYLNGEKLENITQWTLNIGNSSVVLRNSVGQTDDVLQVYVITDGEYTIDSDVITFNDVPAQDADIEITQFSNHDAIGLERKTYDVVNRTSLTLGSEESNFYNLLSGGRILLDTPAKASKYVWIARNGVLLTPGVDYALDKNKKLVNLVVAPAKDDVIEVIHFGDVRDTGRFAWSQFKDILNRTHYKRIGQTTTLAKALSAFDVRIEVEDASVLPEPEKSANRPGIVWIDGERIEYFIKDGNLLRQIRRGTLGTGVKELNAVGTEVYNQGSENNIPYKDELLTQVFEAASLQDTFSLNFTPESVNDFEVFVAGRRLRKNAVSKFDLTIDQDSPAADVTVPAEFTLNGTDLVLENSVAATVAQGQNVTVIRKVGKRWTPSGVSIRDDEGAIAKFVRQGQTNLPK